jgi:hypothetical protein
VLPSALRALLNEGFSDRPLDEALAADNADGRNLAGIDQPADGLGRELSHASHSTDTQQVLGHV